MPEPQLVRLTPSSVRDLDCSKKFRTLRIDKNYPRRNQAVNRSAEYASALHRVLKAVFDPRDGLPPHMENLDPLIRDAFSNIIYATPTERREQEARCRRMVLAYLDWVEDDPPHTVAVERHGKCILKHSGVSLYEVYARFDRVLVRPTDLTTLICADTKTFARQCDLFEAFLTLLVAKHLYPSYARFVVEIDTINEDCEIERQVITGADVKGIHVLVWQRLQRVLADTSYEPEPGEVCRFCPLAPECQPAIDVEVDDQTFEFG